MVVIETVIFSTPRTLTPHKSVHSCSVVVREFLMQLYHPRVDPKRGTNSNAGHDKRQ